MEQGVQVSEGISIAVNNGEIGGGEVMALAIAEAVRDLGREVTVVGPEGSPVLDAALQRDLPVVGIRGSGRRSYMINLRIWDLRARNGLLWCNGLVPAAATAGHRHRVIHVHLLPVGMNMAALRVARMGAEAVIVPSEFVAEHIPRAHVMWNWSDEVSVTRHPLGRVPATIGFLGRPSVAKGVVVLAQAVQILNHDNPDRVRLVVAGEPHFVSENERVQVNGALNLLGAAVSQPGKMSVTSFLSQVDVAVYPSLVPETFGLVAVETMSAQVPFVVSNAGALPEVVGPGHPWVVPAGDPEALAAGITAAMENRDHNVIEQAHRRWSDLFSPAAGRERVAVLLDSIGV